MDVLSKHAIGKVLRDDALKLSSEAKIAKQKDQSVIDGTLGIFYYEDGKFHTHRIVKRVFESLNDEEIYLYSTSDGGVDFQNATINHLFRETRVEIEEDMLIKCIATPGGTGALVSSCYLSLDMGETLLIPTPCWGPYVGIAEHRNINISKFFMLDNDAFNLKEFREKANEIIKKQNKLVFFLNDPCNNPTGYSMKDEEMNNLINYLNNTNVPCVIVYDCAYMDMASEGINKTREKLKLFKKCNENIIVCLCLSYSKTYFIYGQRLGAQIIIGKDKKAVTDFYNAANYLARNTWSNCNRGMISLVTIVDKDIDKRLALDNELSIVQDLLKKRSEIFINEAKEVGLYFYPYNGGFFISIPCKDNKLVYEKLKEEEKVYLLPMNGMLRVAICSLPIKDIKGLAYKIKRVIDKYAV